jgi:hypothetical protein
MVRFPRARRASTTLAGCLPPTYTRARRTVGRPESRQAITPPDGAQGRRRFQRYIEALADPGSPGSGATYPDLASRPWHNASDFPLVGYLESNYRAIRAEILALGDTSFHRESERIHRTGDWEVVFLYERGRRHDECARHAR